MMAGRDALADRGMWVWADEGVKWLNEQFKGKGLEFTTSVDIEKREVLFGVWRKNPNAGSANRRPASEKVLELVEPIESFVSHTTLTKIILIAG